MNALDFDTLRTANEQRCARWHPNGLHSWSASDWLAGVTGEVGELASLIKMMNRERDGLPGNKFVPTIDQIADEMADVVIYMDLLAAFYNIDLGNAVIRKFNAVSERNGFPDRLSKRTAAE